MSTYGCVVVLIVVLLLLLLCVKDIRHINCNENNFNLIFTHLNYALLGKCIFSLNSVAIIVVVVVLVVVVLVLEVAIVTAYLNVRVVLILSYHLSL